VVGALGEGFCAASLILLQTPYSKIPANTANRIQNEVSQMESKKTKRVEIIRGES
jgi:hypothetical protein